MSAFGASVKQADSQQQKDLIKHGEHCSADREKLAAAGLSRGRQVRIKRSDDEYGLYTVSEARQETPDNVVRMGKGGRERLGTIDEFDCTLDAQVTDPTRDDGHAERAGQFIERLDDEGAPTGLIVIAPHGGAIEVHTDQQAEHVRSQLVAKGVKSVSSWLCKGWHPNGAYKHWHITATDIHPASFPLLNSVISRGFSHAVAFHGFDDDASEQDDASEDAILVGGLACEALKEKVKAAIEDVVPSKFTVRLTKPDDPLGGNDERNIVNRLTAGGRHGIQIEQKKEARKQYWECIADAIVKVYEVELARSAPRV
jgi:phage replication-related protein YjqB (UPF0714/DUF867 family)